MFVIVTLNGTWDKSMQDAHHVLFLASGVGFYLSSSVNPLLYSVMSKRFRRGFRDMFSKSGANAGANAGGGGIVVVVNNAAAGNGGGGGGGGAAMANTSTGAGPHSAGLIVEQPRGRKKMLKPFSGCSGGDSDSRRAKSADEDMERSEQKQ